MLVEPPCFFRHVAINHFFAKNDGSSWSYFLFASVVYKWGMSCFKTEPSVRHLTDGVDGGTVCMNAGFCFLKVQAVENGIVPKDPSGISQ